MEADRPAPGTLTESQRRRIFFELVIAQDAGTTVEESRRDIAHRFGVTKTQVEEIEREGLAHDWAPL